MQVEKMFMSQMAAEMATVCHSYITDYTGDLCDKLLLTHDYLSVCTVLRYLYTENVLYCMYYTLP